METVSPVRRSTYPRSSCRLADTMRCAGAPVSRVVSRSAWAALSVIVLAIGACAEGRAAGRDVDDPSLRLEGSAPTVAEVGRRALTALSEGDVAALQALRLTEHEHNDVVWPELPASAPEVGFPVDFAWSNIEGRNIAALSRIAPTYQGEALVFQDVECRGDTQTFETFRVLTDCWVAFTREGSADVWQAQLFEDVLVRGGGHKIFRYYDEEPRRYPPAAALRSRAPRS